MNYQAFAIDLHGSWQQWNAAITEKNVYVKDSICMSSIVKCNRAGGYKCWDGWFLFD